MSATDLHMSAHRVANLLEDANWLLDSGETMERTAARLGMTVDALEKMIERHG